MAILGKKGDKKKPDKTRPKGGSEAPPKPPKQPKPPKPYVPPDIYTLLLGLATLFFIVAVIVLGLNYYWYQNTEPPVIPMNWAR